MKAKVSITRRLLAVLIVTAFLLASYPYRAAALDSPKIIIEIGQPSVWSLGQAHYLLAKMHRRDRKLSTKFPGEDDLDSNRISATRIEALRSSLGVEGQFDQAMGVKNNLASQRYREGEARRATARTGLPERQAELQQVNNELADLNEQIALAEEEDRQSTEARGRSTPPAPATTEDNERMKQLVVMRVKKTRKEEQRTELKSQVVTLQTTADTPTSTPTFEEPATSLTNSVPNPASFQKFMDKAVAEAGKPDLSASMKLDNFVGMQYEIISKQLTLLRDEVGPEDRVIFFELPASIYTVDKKADDYVAQIEWELTSFCDKEPPASIQEQVIRETLLKEGQTEANTESMLMRIDKAREAIITRRAWERLRSSYQSSADVKVQMDILDQSNDVLEVKIDRLNGSAKKELLEFKKVEIERVEIDGAYGRKTVPYPITLEMIKKYRATSEGKCEEGHTEQVRAIDIIPRQSALNVNEYHSTVKETMILAAFKFLVGFAGKVSYQRQRELYEQFVQQQIFASGYGKGQDKFGWTYGPQPGTKRIAPGERTTFAVLVVPRNTLAVELKARSRFYKRNISPRDEDSNHVTGSPDSTFLLSVPGKRTQEFWVDGISYAPVKKGKRVTAVIEGNYFSPQLGIMVNGVPLEPVLSISRIAGDDEEGDVHSADGVVGEYEVTNPRQIVLSFTMGDSYVGTPTIMFTSPEKSTAINFFDLSINHRNTLDSLQEHSVREPMFIEEFGDKLDLEVIREIAVVDAAGNPLDIAGNRAAEDQQGRFKLVRVKGAGLRPGGQLALNDIPIPYRADLTGLAGILEYTSKTGRPTPLEPFAAQDSSRSYFLYFPDPKKDKWKITYRQLTRQGYEEGAAVKDFASPSFKAEVKNYRFLPGLRRAEVDLNILSKKLPLARVVLEDPSGGRCLGAKLVDEHQYRVKCLVPADNGGKIERNSILIKAVLNEGGGNMKDVYADIELPVRPELFNITNPRTGRASGFADEQPVVVITGANLQGVTSVFFGSEKADVIGATAGSITVRVPKIAGINQGQASAVPIGLQSSSGQIPSGAIYTYLGQPFPVELIVSPRTRRAQN